MSAIVPATAMQVAKIRNNVASDFISPQQWIVGSHRKALQTIRLDHAVFGISLAGTGSAIRAGDFAFIFRSSAFNSAPATKNSAMT